MVRQAPRVRLFWAVLLTTFAALGLVPKIGAVSALLSALCGRLAAAETINLSTPTLSFTGGVDGPNPAAQVPTIANSGTGTLTWTATPSKPWLTITPYGGIVTVGTANLTVQPVVSQTEGWQGAIATGPLSARLAPAVVWTGKEMIVWGGQESAFGFWDQDGARYNPVTNTWSGMSTVNAPGARSFSAAVWDGNAMIVWGGWDGSTVFNDGALYDPATDTWFQGTSLVNQPIARNSCASVWDGTEMLIWGGGDGMGGTYGDGYRYNPATNTWTGQIAAAGAPGSRSLPAAVWTGTEMIIWGGWNGTNFFYDGKRYNPATNTWSAAMASLNSPPPRRGMVSAWDGDRMFVWGGYDNSGGRGDGAWYDPATDQWTGAVQLPPGGGYRRYAGSCWTGKDVIYWGGYDGTSDSNDGEVYQPPIHLKPGTYTAQIAVTDPNASNSPQNLTVTLTVEAPTIQTSAVDLGFSAPTAGPNPAAQTVNLTNTGVTPANLRWSAVASQPWLTVSPVSGLTTTGTAVLSVQPILTQAESWNAAISTTNAPSARTGASVVWTGKRMIVWGGFSGGTRTDGALYDPAANTWTAMTQTNAPGGRYYHSAVWDGTEMIMWGGYNGTMLPDGARYNPATDVWSIGLSNTNAPLARYGHSAIWDGTEMIIWGGKWNSSQLSDGRKYNPATNTWSNLIALASAPSARSFHTAVWDGSQMIIWGGTNGAAPLATGGCYHPDTDTWSGFNSSGAPVARASHVAVFDGSEMIVWGGDNGSGSSVHNDGGRYNPATNSWTGTTTITGAPLARTGADAVWTGSRMLVWGGFSGGTYRGDGTPYQPLVNLGAGVHTGLITLNDPNASNDGQTIHVSFSVTNTANVAPVIASGAAATPNPVVENNTTSVSVSATDADSGPASLTYTWWKISGPGDVRFSPNATTGSSLSTATFTASGTYTLGVSVNDGAAVVTDSIAGIVVTLNPVTSDTPSLTYTSTIGSATVISQNITLTNTGASTVTVTLSNLHSWLTSQKLGGGAPTVAIGAGGSATFTVTANPSGQTGTVFDTLTITNSPSGSTQTIPVTFTLNPPPSSGGKKSGCAVGASGGAEFALAAVALMLLLAGLRNPAVARKQN